MTVGLVVVSHSAALAAGVRELAVQMAPAVTIAVAGGGDDGGLGTSFDKINAALAEADSGAGVVVLYDLGSAQLTAETAVEFADAPAAERIEIVDAPLVEGTMAAAVSAQSGADLAAVVTAARQAGHTWAAERPPTSTATPAGDVLRVATIADPVGIHARPAAQVAGELAHWPGVTMTVGRVGELAVDIRNVLAVIGLGVRNGEQVQVGASGPAAAAAVDRIVELLEAADPNATSPKAR